MGQIRREHVCIVPYVAGRCVLHLSPSSIKCCLSCETFEEIIVLVVACGGGGVCVCCLVPHIRTNEPRKGLSNDMFSYLVPSRFPYEHGP